MWNISWVLLRDFDRKIEGALRLCEIYATPDDRRPKSKRIRVCQELIDCSDEDVNSCQESLQFVAPSGCPFYNPTNEKTLYLKPCSLLTNDVICDRKTAF